MFIGRLLKLMVGTLQFGQRAPSITFLQRGQVFSSIVRPPQLGQFHLYVITPQLEHFLLVISTRIIPVFAALTRSLRGPPAKSVGNNTWTRGDIFLALAFSGRPILAPTKVGALSLTVIPEDVVIVSTMVGLLLSLSFDSSTLRHEARIIAS